MTDFEGRGYAAGLAQTGELLANGKDIPVGGQLYNAAYTAVSSTNPQPGPGSEEWWLFVMGYIHGYYDAVNAA